MQGVSRRGSRGVGLVATALLVLLAAAGCGRGRGTRPDDSAAKPAPLRERLRQAAAAAAEAPSFVLRYNPAPEACGCPATELQVGDAWRRVRLVPRGADAATLATWEESAARAAQTETLRRYTVQGRLDERPIPVCRNGALGFELALDEL